MLEGVVSRNSVNNREKTNNGVNKQDSTQRWKYFGSKIHFACFYGNPPVFKLKHISFAYFGSCLEIFIILSINKLGSFTKLRRSIFTQIV